MRRGCLLISLKQKDIFLLPALSDTSIQLFRNWMLVRRWRETRGFLSISNQPRGKEKGKTKGLRGKTRKTCAIKQSMARGVTRPGRRAAVQAMRMRIVCMGFAGGRECLVFEWVNGRMRQTGDCWSSFLFLSVWTSAPRGGAFDTALSVAACAAVG